MVVMVFIMIMVVVVCYGGDGVYDDGGDGMLWW